MDRPGVIDKNSSKVRNRRVHMANERTFLAWIRTSIGIMAFGFVVEKFALFVKQISLVLAGSEMTKDLKPFGEKGGELFASRGYSSVLGIMLVALGASMAVLSFIRYKKVERQIDNDTYQPSAILDTLLALSVIAIGIFLIIYLVYSI
jgi:uncharacterized membrane protein YidH (DUF202 family)